MQKRNKTLYFSRKGWVSYLKIVKRRRRFERQVAGEKKHEDVMRKAALAKGRLFWTVRKSSQRSRPQQPLNIKYLSSLPEVFHTGNGLRNDGGHFFLPDCFSLIDNYEESFVFLNRLFWALYRGKTEKITLDYKNCQRIDVDASICMDVMLGDFISYIQGCRSGGHKDILPKLIVPVNFERPDLIKVLFSIGAYRNLKGLQIRSPDVEALPVLINTQGTPDIWAKSELHLTHIVEYIKRCLKRMQRELSTEAETEFYKVIGEVMSNAEEHSTMPQRFAIGYFQEADDDDGHFGIFNFSIFNFGDTIYQTFKSPGCKNPKAVQQMSHLSEEYTKKGWFRKADFEEETLWTLYALQEGVTSKEKKRGNGSIQYIENFFRLKGDDSRDPISKLLIHSGHSRILFDGTYRIVKSERVGEKRSYKMITFNDSGRIEDKPDKKYVTFAPYYFPGTMISARILIKFNNTNA